MNEFASFLRFSGRLATTAVLLVAVVGCGQVEAPSERPSTPAPSSTSYDDLVTLFREWRELEQPRFVDGVPDYTAAAMAAQHQELAHHQARLAAIDPSGWPVSQQVDHAIVRAEMEEELPSKTGPSGVGKDNYTWYLQNVHLVPYTWEEVVTLMRRELWRSHSALALEEHRNRALPPLERISTSCSRRERPAPSAV